MKKKNLVFVSLLLSVVLMVSLVSAAGITGYYLYRGSDISSDSGIKVNKIANHKIILSDGTSASLGEQFRDEKGTKYQIEEIKKSLFQPDRVKIVKIEEAPSTSEQATTSNGQIGEQSSLSNNAQFKQALENLCSFVNPLYGNDFVPAQANPTTSTTGLNFRNIAVTCYDGSSTTLGDATSCKSSSLWVSYADDFCVNKCDSTTGKCGVNTFSLSNPCTSSNQQQNFKNVHYDCYGGLSGDLGDATSCKSSSLWMTYINSACAGSCDSTTGKCGLNGFSFSNSC